jgi:hypothetical protein
MSAEAPVSLSVLHEPSLGYVTAVRWCCPTCSRFISRITIRSWDEIDHSCYYGVRGVIIGTCRKCGEVEDPPCRPIKFSQAVIR